MGDEFEILISVGRRHTRIALVEEDRLVEVKIERERGLLGSIYKGIVEQVLPGMDSAFVKIGLDRNAFLHVSDVVPEAARAHRGRRSRSERNHDDVDEGLVSPAEAGPASGKGRPGKAQARAAGSPTISDLLRKGQEILVQLVKEPIGPKGARVTTRISLPGRYVVLIPVGADYEGVSRRVTEDAERTRLRELARQARPSGEGLIIRTESQGCELEEIAEDVRGLQALWRKIRGQFRRLQGPGLIHQDLSLTERVIRDRFSDRVTRIVTDSRTEYERAIESLRPIAPQGVERVEFHEGPSALFEAWGVEQQIQAALKKRVPLPSGGNLQIQETEALVVVDVNTGRFVGRTALADTVLKTNLEAVEEIARQLRLRDLGGIIVIDFIDMASAAHRRQVLDGLRDALAEDRAKSRVLGFSALGLVQMTRKRTGESLVQSRSTACRVCGGEGRVRAPWTLVEEVEEELHRIQQREKAEAYRIRLPLEAAYELVGSDESSALSLEEEIGATLGIRVSLDLPSGPFEIRPTTRQRIEREVRNIPAGQVVSVEPVWYDAPENPVLIASWQGYLFEIKNPDAMPQGNATEVLVRFAEMGRNLGVAEIVAEKPRARPRQGRAPEGPGAGRGPSRRRTRRAPEATAQAEPGVSSAEQPEGRDLGIAEIVPEEPRARPRNGRVPEGPRAGRGPSRRRTRRAPEATAQAEPGVSSAEQPEAVPESVPGGAELGPTDSGAGPAARQASGAAGSPAGKWRAPAREGSTDRRGSAALGRGPAPPRAEGSTDWRGSAALAGEAPPEAASLVPSPPEPSRPRSRASRLRRYTGRRRMKGGATSSPPASIPDSPEPPKSEN